MASFIISLDIKVPLARLRKAIARAPSVVADVVQESARETFIPAARQILEANKSIFTKRLWRDLGVEVDSVNSVEIKVNMGALTVDYAEAVEKGAKPGNPDLQHLIKYVEFKTGRSGAEADSTARAIAHTLRTKGSKPHPFIVPAFRLTEGAFKKAVERKLTRRLFE